MGAAACQCASADAAAAQDGQCEAQPVIDGGLSKEQALAEAVKGSDEQFIKGYIEQGSDVEALHRILFDACAEADTEKVTFLARCGVAFDIVGSAGKTLYQVAAENGDSNTTKFLLEKGGNVDATGQMQCTPLLLALAGGHEGVAVLLLEGGANKKLADGEGRSPLMLSVEKGQFGAAKLLAQDVAPAEADSLNQALVAACAADDWPLVLNLVGLGAVSVHMTEKGASSPLALAIEKGQTEVGQSLLKSASKEDKAEMNKRLRQALTSGKLEMSKNFLACGLSPDTKDAAGRTALLSAIAAGKKQEATAKFLIENGANKAAKGKDGKSALDLAVDKGSSEVVQLLLKHGVKAPAAYKDAKKLLEAAEKGQEAKAAIFLACGANVQTKDDASETPLHKAAQNGHVQVVQMLLDKKADIEAKGGEYECSPLYAAAKENKLETFKLLLERGADKETRQKDDRPIIGQAARTDNKDMVILLLEKGANINGADCDNDTALHIVSMNAQFDMAKLLVERKADTKAKNNKGKTPLALAAGKFDWKGLMR